MKPGIFCCALALFTLFGCAKQVTKKPAEHTDGPSNGQPYESVSSLATQNKDTLIYIVDFKDSLQHRQFITGLDRLIKKFPSQPMPQPEKSRNITIKIVTPGPPSADVSQQPRTNDSVLSPIAASPVSAKTPPPALHPAFGGSIRLYAQRAFIDDNIERMLCTNPFDKKSCSGSDTLFAADYVSVKNTADKGVMLSLAPSIQGGDGRIASAFDIVTGWSDYAKKHPAEAVALFRYVAGVQQFVSGREGVITGFQIVDDKTIVVQFNQTDLNGLTRLRTSRLMPPPFKLGPYFIKTEKNNVITLLPNMHYPLGRPYLNACEIKLGGDPNPVLSYSMRRFEAMTIFSLKDLDYARHLPADQSMVVSLAEDRYFLSLATPAAEVRQFIRRMIDARDILNNYVKAEGAPLKYIETDAPMEDSAPSARKSALSAAPSSPPMLSILYRKDDPASGLIAEKLLAELARAGLSCALKGCLSEDYERGLIRRDFAIAVGWAPSRVLDDPSERLRLSALWFNDEVKEALRIESAQEIPLFTVKTYLLTNKNIIVPESGLAGMFVQ